MLNKTDSVGSFLKGLAVLECFGADRAKLSIAEASELTGMDRATVRRYLLTLHQAGYATYDGKYFMPTARVLRLGMSALSALPLPRLVQPWLDQLSERINQSCSVCILDETDVVYIARAAQRRVMSVGLLPGSRLPAHCTSVGRVLLAAMPADQAEHIIKQSNLTPRTPKSLTDPDRILTAIRQVSNNGFAFIDQEVELGLCSLAVPLFNIRGETVAALNTGMAVIQDQNNEVIAQHLPALLEVQEGLQRVLS